LIFSTAGSIRSRPRCGARAREFIEALIRGELDEALAWQRYQRAADEGRAAVTRRRHGSRTQSLTGTFGPIENAVLRARLDAAQGKTTEWKSQALRAYQRRTLTPVPTLRRRRGGTANTAACFLDQLTAAMLNIEGTQVDGGSQFMADFEQACQANAIYLYVCRPHEALAG
jgi:hypothetical protein